MVLEVNMAKKLIVFGIPKSKCGCSKLDACAFVANVYDEGNILCIVTDSSPHGINAAGIAIAFHEKEPVLNGVASGQKCDLINMSYREPTLTPVYGHFVDLLNEVVNKHCLISSAVLAIVDLC
ncbi:hypothetical protein NE237_016303 [Protea cynaroides]|uniref:Uncharacterized protein n=1 Tax=Protea cynaroides TaxID=273540 RepID=A0A9Q0GKA2_9MAGN|nr:hypothetical protein NE237_016303 [Protea cynaroides]